MNNCAKFHKDSASGKKVFVARNMMNKCAKFHKDSASGKKVKFNNKIEELSEVTEKLKPLFVCVQETWCVHGEPDSFYHIDGFSLFRRDRADRIGGGVCIYVNTSQAHTIEQMQLDNDIKAIWLKITAENIPKPIIIASIYRPPTNPIDPFLSSLDRCLRRTNQLHDHYTLLAGDFNARNSCWYVEDTTDDVGDSLHQLFSLFGLQQLNHFPTNIYADQLKSCLDLISTDIPSVRSRSTEPLGKSDHSHCRIHAAFSWK